jgi:hypothetical protein
VQLLLWSVTYLSKVDKTGKENAVSSKRIRAKRKSNEVTNEAHLSHVASVRNGPSKKQAMEAPMASAAGLGGRLSAGARPPGTINEVPLTTATGTVSESEQLIAASPYGKVLPPQLTPEGKFKCRCCNQLFDSSEEYTRHYNQNHLPEM